MNTASCKVGTIPEYIWLRHHYKIVVGKIILFRRLWSGQWTHRWEKGRIWRVNPRGFFFVELS